MENAGKRSGVDPGAAWVLLIKANRAATTEACRTTREAVDRPLSSGNVLSKLGGGFVSAAGCRVSGIALGVIALARSGSSARHPPPPAHGL